MREGRGVGVWLGLLDEEDGHAEATRVEEVRPQSSHVGRARNGTTRRWRGAVSLNGDVTMAVVAHRRRPPPPPATSISTVEAVSSCGTCLMAIEAVPTAEDLAPLRRHADDASARASVTHRTDISIHRVARISQK